jgi:hypothetical protein
MFGRKIRPQKSEGIEPSLGELKNGEDAGGVIAARVT